MAVNTVFSPFPLFTDADGDPLEAGYIWIGVEGLNPETNPVAIFWDDAKTQPAAQPVRTINGYPSRDGTPSALYTAGAYGITVRDRNRELVFSDLSAGYSIILTIDRFFDDVTAFLADTTTTYPTGTILNTRAEGFAYEVVTTGEDLTTAGGVKLRVRAGLDGYNVRAYGAPMDGTGDDTPAFNKAIAAANAAGGGTVHVPSGGTLRLQPVALASTIGGTGTNSYILNVKDVDNVSFTFDSPVLVEIGATRSDLFYLENASNIDIGPFSYTVNGTQKCDIVQAYTTDHITFRGSRSLGGTATLEALVTAETSSKNWRVEDHYLDETVDWDAGVAFYDFVENIHIHNNTFRGGSAFYPIDLERRDAASQNVFITGNDIKDGRYVGIKSAVDQTIISNNVVDGMTEGGPGADVVGGIETLDAHFCTISNNVVRNCAGHGIRIVRGGNTTISGNFTSSNNVGLIIDPTTSGGTVTNVLISADNAFRELTPVQYQRPDNVRNVRDLRPDANARLFDVGHLIDFAGVQNPLFSRNGATFVRGTSSYPFGNTGLRYPAAGATNFDRIALAIPDEYWTPYKGKPLQVTLNYRMGSAAYTGSARIRFQDGVNDYNVTLPLQTAPLDYTFTFVLNSAATSATVTVYAAFGDLPSHDLFFNHMTIGAASNQPGQKKFATAIPVVPLANGEIVYNPSATSTPFAWIRGGGAWRVLA